MTEIVDGGFLFRTRGRQRRGGSSRESWCEGSIGELVNDLGRGTCVGEHACQANLEPREEVLSRTKDHRMPKLSAGCCATWDDALHFGDSSTKKENKDNLNGMGK